METVFVKPKKGLLVRSPRTRAPLPEEGSNVPWIGADGRFWRRRVRDGDVVICDKVKKDWTRKNYSKEEENNGARFSARYGITCFPPASDVIIPVPG